MDSRLIELTQASSVLPPLQRLPLEIITQIVKHLSLRDILSLASVSKIWRCVYLNQNIIWKEVCLNLNIREEDYMSCVLDTARNSHKCTRYVDAYSTKLFGPTCRWWLLYNLYNQVLRNIMDNDFPLLHIPRDQVEQSYCTDDYIVNLHRQYCIRIELVLLKGNDMPTEKINLKLFDQFKELYGNKHYSLNVVGNKKFLVFEIRSVIFVYEIVYGEFIPRFWKTIRKSDDYNPRKVKMLPDIQFFEDKHNTKIDLSEDKFALIHPFDNTVFVIDLPSQSIFKELVYSSKLCVINS